MIVFEIFLCWLAADLISGIFHWVEDTYLGLGSGPISKYISEPNIYHHKFPGALAKESWWSLNIVSTVLSLVVGLVAFLFGVRDWHFYLVVLFCTHLNQIHAWSHTPRPPYAVKVMQRIGLMTSVSQHALHHKRPYENNYCTTTNYLNPVLDSLGVWRGLERLRGLKVLRGSSERNLY